MKPKEQQSNDEMDISICHQNYEVVTTLKTLEMRPAKRLGPVFFRLFHCCFTMCRDSAPAIVQELL